VLIFEHERLSREPKGKGRELLQILISRNFETGIIQHAVLDAARPALYTRL
jgi:hypothetical protein